MSARYGLTTCFRYTYPAPIGALRQRLVVTPPATHGAQRRVASRIEVSQPARRRDLVDRWGNEVVELSVARVAESIEFCAEVVVDRDPWAGPHRIEPDARYRRASPLTAPDAALVEAACSLSAGLAPGRDLAERICAWVHDAVRYHSGTTTVATTAAEALALGVGVCQDSAHVMLAVCRLAGMPARYVSGHLLGEGASHAWVEVLLDDGDGRWRVVALDPCNQREADDRYLTVAVGRDYADVAPTSGRYTSPFPGVLTATKRAEALAAA